MIHFVFLMWVLTGISGGVLPKEKEIKEPSMLVECSNLSSSRLSELFSLEVNLHIRSLSKLHKKSIKNLSLFAQCTDLKFKISIIHSKTRQILVREFVFPHGAVDMERIVALAAAQMLWADLQKRVKLIKKREKEREKARKSVLKKKSSLKIIPKKKIIRNDHKKEKEKEKGENNWSVGVSVGLSRLSGKSSPLFGSSEIRIYRTMLKGLSLFGAAQYIAGTYEYDTGSVAVSMAGVLGGIQYSVQPVSYFSLHGGLSLGVLGVLMRGSSTGDYEGHTFTSSTASFAMEVGVGWNYKQFKLMLSVVSGIFAPQVEGIVANDENVDIAGLWSGVNFSANWMF
jgi:hypothetical protein